jgi:Ca2+-binding RTX toxin-like protein
MALILGTSGNDTRVGTTGDDTIRLFGGNDLGRGRGGGDTIYGGFGRDSLEGDNGDDRLYGGGDNDRLIGGNGDDRLWGGGGHDTLWAGAGDDRLSGDDGNDLLLVSGGGATDIAFGGNGHDRISGDQIDSFVAHGDSGNDEIEVGSGTLHGDAGNDALGVTYGGVAYGGAGHDRLDSNTWYGTAEGFGGSGNDRLDEWAIAHGGNGDDLIIGGEERYQGYVEGTLFGDAGKDLILGGGPDTVYGGAGNDALQGGQVWGGAGTDTFRFRGAHPDRYGPDSGYVWSNTIVRDFQANENILTTGQRLSSGDSYGIDGIYDVTLVPITREDISFSRSGNNLVLSTPSHPDSSGGMASSSMTLVGFFSNGFTYVTIDGQTVDVPGSA